MNLSVPNCCGCFILGMARTPDRVGRGHSQQCHEETQEKARRGAKVAIRRPADAKPHARCPPTPRTSKPAASRRGMLVVGSSSWRGLVDRAAGFIRRAAGCARFLRCSGLPALRDADPHHSGTILRSLACHVQVHGLCRPLPHCRPEPPCLPAGQLSIRRQGEVRTPVRKPLCTPPRRQRARP